MPSGRERCLKALWQCAISRVTRRKLAEAGDHEQEGQRTDVGREESTKGSEAWRSVIDGRLGGWMSGKRNGMGMNE
jgi:hypothetical protein